MAKNCDVIVNGIRINKDEFIKGMIDSLKLSDDEIKNNSKYLNSINYALQKQSAGDVLQRQQATTGSTGGERGRVESSKQGDGTTQKSTPPPINEEKVKDQGKEKKDLGQIAREEAKKFREGKKNVLPSFLRMDLPPDVKVNGIDLNTAWANALDAFATVHDATRDFAKAIEEGFKHIKDWFNENKIDFDEEKMKSDFEKEMLGEGETIGISHEAQVRRIGKESVERGEGVTAEEAVLHGRDLLDKGESPQKAAGEFKKDRKISYDALSLVRAEHERLAKETNRAIEQFGENSPQATVAFKAESDWLKNVVKPMQTEWSKIGMVQQGETDIDTGSFVGLKRAFSRDNNGKEMSPKQEKEAKNLTAKVKDLTAKVDELSKKLTNALSKQSNKEKADKILRENKKRKNDDEADLIFLSAKRDMVAARVAKDVSEGKSIDESVEQIGKEGIIKPENVEKAKKYFKELAGESDKKFKSPIDLAEHFVGKKDNKFTPEEAKSIWDYAKENYIDKGESYGNMLRGVSADLGLTAHQIREALSSPKGAREITDEMYRAQERRRLAINHTKAWLKIEKLPRYKKFMRALPNFFFRLKVFGHGTVGGVTHAGMNLFQPSKWKIYFPFFIKQFKYAFGSSAEYAKAMEDLKLDPEFIFWKRAGLAVDPTEIYDDFQALKPMFGRLSVAGDRGFNALKVYRLDLAKSFYSNLSDVEKADLNSAREIAKLVNHSTGTSEVRTPQWLNTAFFAPKLEISRWQRLITDPAKAANTFINWGKATSADKVAAKIVAKNAGEMMATYMACLAANSAILSLTGSKQSINFSDPTKSDWLKFKVAGKTLDVSGGMEATMRFLASILHTSYIAYQGSRQDLNALHGDRPQEKDYKDLMKQARYKMSPFLSTVSDIVTGTDAMGRPMPFSKVKPYKGEKPYTVGGYILQQQTPIPIAEGIRETTMAMKQNGMSDNQINDIFKGLLVGAISGGTGAKVGEDYDLEKGGSGGGGGTTSPTFHAPKFHPPRLKAPH